MNPILNPLRFHLTGKFSFEKCEKLVQVCCCMDSRLRVFGERGFYKSRVESMAIPSHVHEIGKDCFALTPL